MNWNPHDYAKNSSAQLAWGRELISRITFVGSEAALDVGCGDGKITAEFARALPGGYVLGVDSSPEFIASQSTVSLVAVRANGCPIAQHRPAIRFNLLQRYPALG